MGDWGSSFSQTSSDNNLLLNKQKLNKMILLKNSWLIVKRRDWPYLIFFYIFVAFLILHNFQTNIFLPPSTSVLLSFIANVLWYIIRKKRNWPLSLYFFLEWMFFFFVILKFLLCFSSVSVFQVYISSLILCHFNTYTDKTTLSFLIVIQMKVVNYNCKIKCVTVEIKKSYKRLKNQ